MHPQERDDHREVRDRVDVEEETRAERGRVRERREDEATDDRSDDLGPVERRRVEADRAHEIALGHEPRDHRLPRRRVEGEDRRVQRA